jgi:predicted metalloprotease
MRWESGRRSDNIEDRRGMGLGGKGLVGGGIGTVVIALIALFMGVDPGIVLNQIADAPRTEQAANAPTDPREERLKEFVSVVLADTEDTWGELFRRSGAQYANPKLVLFSGAVQSACGHAQAAMGPFYCPGDHKLYLDMSFFDDLARRHDAPGDFAQAYVIAHEVGHHVQTLLGIAEKVQAARQRAGEAESNRLQVRMELQADCFAGIWATRRAASWSGATWRKPWAPPPAWVTTACSARPGATWCRIPSPTAPRNSACAGSRSAPRPASPSAATPSRRRGCEAGTIQSDSGNSTSVKPKREKSRIRMG